MTRHRSTTGTRVATILALAAIASGCAAPVPTAPQPSATPVATPSPGPDEVAAAAVLASFGRLMARDDLAYHLSQATTTRVSGRRAARSGSEIDVDGPSFAGTVSTTGNKVRVVQVDGVTWTKTGKRAWQKGSTPSSRAAEEVLDTWSSLVPLDGLAYAGRSSEDPSRLDFANTQPVDYQTTAMREQGMQGVIDELTLTLAPDGTPLGIRFHATGSFTSGALADRKAGIDTVIDITRFGEDITVTPPK
jgi:hypothetical protein